jgi:hypothetical protein
MDWKTISDVWIGLLFAFGAAWPIVTRRPMQILIPFKGMYIAGTKVKIFLQVLYLSAAALFLWPVVLRLAVKG